MAFSALTLLVLVVLIFAGTGMVTGTKVRGGDWAGQPGFFPPRSMGFLCQACFACVTLTASRLFLGHAPPGFRERPETKIRNWRCLTPTAVFHRKPSQVIPWGMPTNPNQQSFFSEPSNSKHPPSAFPLPHAQTSKTPQGGQAFPLASHSRWPRWAWRSPGARLREMSRLTRPISQAQPGRGSRDRNRTRVRNFGQGQNGERQSGCGGGNTGESLYHGGHSAEVRPRRELAVGRSADRQISS